jgi:hypothetical protein
MNPLVAVVISILFMVAKMVLHKEKQPPLKEGVLVLLSSMGGLYAMEQFGKTAPKMTEVFTETPSF